MNEFEELDELAAKVLQHMKEQMVDHQVQYERKYRLIYGSDEENLVRIMVDKELARQEKSFLIKAMTAVVTLDIAKRIPAANFRVMRIVKAERATHIRKNKWVAVKRKSYAELKDQQEKMAKAATRRLERDLKRDQPLVPPVQTPTPSIFSKPLQTYFGSILDDVDRGS